MSPNSAEAVVVLSRAQQYSAQMSRAHLLSNGRDSMASPEFGWIDPFEDCEEYHIQDEQELQAEQQWAMKYLLKMSNKKEYRRQKKAAIAAAAAAQAALSTDPNAENEANSAEKKEEDKRSLLAKLFCRKQKASLKVNIRYDVCNIHGPYMVLHRSGFCNKCVQASVEMNQVTDTSDSVAMAKNDDIENAGDEQAVDSNHTTQSEEDLKVVVRGDDYQAKQEVNYSPEIEQPVYENVTQVIEPPFEFAAGWPSTRKALYETATLADCNQVEGNSTC